MGTDIRTLARECVEELFDRGRTSYLSEVSELSYVGHDPVRAKSVSLDEQRQIAESFRGGFPDLRCSVSDVVTEGDRVVCRWRMTGTQQGPFLGFAPTGKSVAFDGISELRFHQGRLAEQWTLYDCFGLLHQLDLLPSLEELSSIRASEERAAARELGPPHLAL
jgi:predicted ester cyclase